MPMPGMNTENFGIHLSTMRIATLVIALVLLTPVAMATGLPPPSRTVYKCEGGGKVHYSDSPCVGAKKVDVTPTRGLNKSSGRELTGADVRRERQSEQFAEGLRPLTGMSHQQLDQFGRRMKLPPEAQRECRMLDGSLTNAEKSERAAQGTPALNAAQVELFKQRKRYRDLGCE